MANEKNRCGWCNDDPAYIYYHDFEWGVPVYDDRLLFEMLILEGAQAGLSWLTILKRRQNYKNAFCDFDVNKVANFTDKDVNRLLNDAGIIRNQRKIASAINNANAFIKVQQEFGCFSDYLWQFVDFKPIVNHWRTLKDLPATTPLSDQVSKELKKREFNFVGSTIVYAYLQSVGLVNDHTLDCFIRQSI